MDFSDGLKVLAEKINKYKDQINTEEATKTAFIMPFFDLLGYDTRNPLEFTPEFIADVGTKKGEKVDYAILLDNQPMILIEAKWCNEPLDKHDHQLLRYFSVTKARIGILTNGIIYKFYTDLEEPNKMDSKPFFEINLLNIKDTEINELKKFGKSNFELNNILSTAEELKYANAIKKVVLGVLDSPDDDFVSYILNSVYDGKKTQQTKDKFRKIIKDSMADVINDIVRSKLENALLPKSEKSEPSIADEVPTTNNDEPKSDIVTTEEELEGYYTIKGICSEFVESKRIFYRDNASYFNILLDDNKLKWICRLFFNSSQKYISFPKFEKDSSGRTLEEKLKLDSIEDIFKYRTKIKEIVEIYLKK